MDYCVQLGFDNINSQETGQHDVLPAMPKGYGVDHVKVAEGLGCKAIRVTEPGKIAGALEQARRLASEHKVPVVVEVFLERITNIAMGTDIDNVAEFEDLAESWEHAPTALMMLD